MLSVCNLSITKPGSTEVLLSNFSYDFCDSKLYNIMGSSGCGKSSFLRVMMGISPPHSGSVFYRNHNIYSDSNIDFYKKKCFVIPQSNTFIGDSVIENLALTLNTHDKNFLSRAYDLWSLFKMPKIDLTDSVSKTQFSGGELQRMSIIRCILKNPDVALLDEPTSALDLNLSRLAYEILREHLPTTILISINHKFPTMINHTLINF